VAVTERINVYMDPTSMENLRTVAKENGLSISAVLRIVFSTPARSTDSIGQVRAKIHRRLEEARGH
jgi:hypothetical protein